MDDALLPGLPVPSPTPAESRAPAMFFLNGVLFAGTLVGQDGPPPAHDDLLTELTWPEGVCVLVDVRLAASDAAVACCAVLPPDDR